MMHDKTMIKHYFDNLQTGIDKCHYPGDACTSPAIKAHSVQNNGVLNLLSDNHHVVMLMMNPGSPDTPPSLEFKKISRHKATTFTGLCNTHDTDLFRPIDTAPIDPTNPEHLFLIAYRSLLRGYHVECETAIKYQITLNKLIEEKKVPENSYSPPMKMATEQWMIAYSFYEYKLLWDTAYQKKDWFSFSHEVIDLGTCTPTIAASSLLQTKQQSNGTDIPSYISINVFPQDGKYWAIYGYLTSHRSDATAELDRILQASGYYQKYLISKQLIQHVENFVLAPQFFDGLSSAKTTAIRDYFSQTMHNPDFELDSEHFYLFAE